MKYKLLLLVFISIAISLSGMKERGTESKGPRSVRRVNTIPKKGPGLVSKTKDSGKKRDHSSQVREYLDSLTEEDCSADIEEPISVKTLPNGTEIIRRPIYARSLYGPDYISSQFALAGEKIINVVFHRGAETEKTTAKKL